MCTFCVEKKNVWDITLQIYNYDVFNKDFSVYSQKNES